MREDCMLVMSMHNQTVSEFLTLLRVPSIGSGFGQASKLCLGCMSSMCGLSCCCTLFSVLRTRRTTSWLSSLRRFSSVWSWPGSSRRCSQHLGPGRHLPVTAALPHSRPRSPAVPDNVGQLLLVPKTDPAPAAQLREESEIDRASAARPQPPSISVREAHDRASLEMQKIGPLPPGMQVGRGVKNIRYDTLTESHLTAIEAKLHPKHTRSYAKWVTG